MLAAGLCYADVKPRTWGLTFFFKCRPSYSTKGGRIATRSFVLTTSMEKLLLLKLGELWSSNVATTTNFVARDGDKLTYPASIVCAGTP